MAYYSLLFLCSRINLTSPCESWPCNDKVGNNLRVVRVCSLYIGNQYSLCTSYLCKLKSIIAIIIKFCKLKSIIAIIIKFHGNGMIVFLKRNKVYDHAMLACRS